MRNFKDAIPPQGKGSVRVIDGTEKDISFPDGWQDGTTVNRDAMMAIQGFDNVVTTFNTDGSITETNALGETCVTVFNADGSITETFTAGSQQMIHKTIFNSDGSISEVIQ